LHTADRRIAAARAAALFGDISAKGWDVALANVDPEKAVHRARTGTTVGDVAIALNAADMRARTRHAYVAALRWWSARHLAIRGGSKEFGRRSEEWREKVDGVALDAFTRKRAEEIRDAFIRSAGADVTASRSARISAKAYLRNAKAALRAAEKLGRLTLPTPRPFDGVTVAGAIVSTYRSEIDAPALLRAARETLRPSDPEAYRVILLGLGAGLRPGEIETLRWRGVDGDSGRVWVSATSSWQAKNAQSEAPVVVSPGLLDELRPFRAGLEDLVAGPAGVKAATRWLRAQGVKTNHPVHALRKEFGSMVNQSADLLTASRQLRHSSIAVTAAVYVESRKASAPDIGKMLGGHQ
jgi:integrase